MEMGGEAWRHGVAQRGGGSGMAVPHSCVVDKIRGDTLGVSDPSPRPDCTTHGSAPGR